MLYNHGWANLKPQQLKYPPALAAKAAKLLFSGESLTATARAVKVSRASLRNWRDRDPKLNEAFGTFEANKVKHEAKRQKVRHFKEVAVEIVDAAREDSPDPVKAGVKAQQQAKAKEVESKPISPEEARERRLQVWWEKGATGPLTLKRNKSRLRQRKCSRLWPCEQGSGVGEKAGRRVCGCVAVISLP